MAANVKDIPTRASNQTLSKALVAARKEIHNPAFDSTNPHFRNGFASLKAVYEAVIPAMLNHGITVLQDFHADGDYWVCRTHVIHESGEQMVFTSPPMEPTKRDPQGWASASTYARRYGLMGVGAIVGDVDDDGNAASAEPPKMAEKQAKAIAALLDSANPDTGEGVDAFAEAWLELDTEEQKKFGPWVGTLYPGKVSATKAHMHAVISAWRNKEEG